MNFGKKRHNTFFNPFVLLLTSSMAGCAAPVLKGTCANTMSVGNASSESLATGLLKGAPVSSGGFIDISFHSKWGFKSNDDIEVRRCSMYLDFSNAKKDFSNPKVEIVRLWTADHCIQPAWDEKVSLQLSTSSGLVEIPVELDILTSALAARKDLEVLPLSVQKQFLEAFNTNTSNVTKNGVQKCKSLTDEVLKSFPSADTYSLACMSAWDVTTMVIKLPSNLSSEQSKAIESAKANFTAIKDKAALPGIPKTVAALSPGNTLARDAYLGFDMLVQARRNEVIGDFLQRISDCQNGENNGEICSEKYLPAIKTLSKKHFQKRNFDRMIPTDTLKYFSFDTMIFTATKDIVGGFEEENGVWQSSRQPTYEAAMKKLDSVFETISESPFSMIPLYLQSNLTMGSDRQQFRSIPAFRSLSDKDSGSGSQGVALFAKDRQILLAINKKKAPYLLLQGDSGTLLNHGVIPLGVLSTVDSVPTEGIVVSILPKGKSDSSSPSAVKKGEVVAPSSEEAQKSKKSTVVDNGKSQVNCQ